MTYTNAEWKREYKSAKRNLYRVNPSDIRFNNPHEIGQSLRNTPRDRRSWGNEAESDALVAAHCIYTLKQASTPRKKPYTPGSDPEFAKRVLDLDNVKGAINELVSLGHGKSKRLRRLVVNYKNILKQEDSSKAEFNFNDFIGFVNNLGIQRKIIPYWL